MFTSVSAHGLLCTSIYIDASVFTNYLWIKVGGGKGETYEGGVADKEGGVK